MANSMRLFATVLLLAMLVLATEMGPITIAEASCPSHNYRFKGRCWSDKDCESICEKDGLSGGHCGARGRLCACIRRC
uniref:Defensin-like protein n=1 Tax=Nicotiana sylvestris TaxID=4096 RepID=A0A1U7WN17_NICSY|nr:PREDICTED: defensin-like protein [Nicotiana sylvestris]